MRPSGRNSVRPKGETVPYRVDRPRIATTAHRVNPWNQQGQPPLAVSEP